MCTFLRELEKDLLLLATNYIEKDRNLRGVSKVKTMTESARTRQVATLNDKLNQYNAKWQLYKNTFLE